MPFIRTSRDNICKITSQNIQDIANKQYQRINADCIIFTKKKPPYWYKDSHN